MLDTKIETVSPLADPKLLVACVDLVQKEDFAPVLKAFDNPHLRELTDALRDNELICTLYVADVLTQLQKAHTWYLY